MAGSGKWTEAAGEMDGVVPLVWVMGGVQTFGSADDLESKSVTPLVIFLCDTNLFLSGVATHC